MQAALMRLVALAALALTAGLALAQLNLMRLPGDVPGFPLSTVEVDPVNSVVLRSAGSDQPVQAALTFDDYPIETELLAIGATDLQVPSLSRAPDGRRAGQG